MAGCQKYKAAQGDDIYLTDLELAALDVDRDVAFLSSKQLANLPISPLQTTDYNIPEDQLEVVGYPNGTLLQFTHTLAYHKNVLLVREDPLQPGHSGAPVFNQQDRVVGIANGGLKGGFALLNWIVPYSHVQLVPRSNCEHDLVRLANMDVADVFARS